MADDKEKSSKVDTTLYFQRMSICGDCEHLKKGIAISRCNLCGCILGAKARMKSEKCPLGKW
jgi:hypothetical protein